ncbi:MAG: hypothetical protein AAFX08_08855 [Pseudomonadota bacterium]
MSDASTAFAALGAAPRSDARVTIVLGAALFVQTGLALIWAGGAAERLAALERKADGTSVVIERTARLEAQMDAVRASLIRIEAKLDRDDGEAR